MCLEWLLSPVCCKYLFSESSSSATFVAAQTLTSPEAAIEQRQKAGRKRKKVSASDVGDVDGFGVIRASVPVDTITSSSSSSTSTSILPETSNTTNLSLPPPPSPRPVQSLAARLNIKETSRAGDDLVAKYSDVRRVKAVTGKRKKMDLVTDEATVDMIGMKYNYMLFCVLR